MTERGDLVRAIQGAQDGAALTQAVAALDNYDTARQHLAAAERELDLGARIVAQRFTPAALHEHHTAATDWLADYQLPADGAYRTAMISEASLWYGHLDRAVKEDAAEFAEQARGRARTAASAWGHQAHAAQGEFLRTAGYLRSTDGASGLPQIDQTVDPNNAPSATPYPVETFPTFGEEQDPFNGIETNSHGSGAASTNAPMLQQLTQQDGSGSGYGSGPEQQLQHDTGFNTQYSYAEVPLGTPGQIPAAPGGGPAQPGSAPTPMMGQPQDAGADRRQAVAAIEGYSMPDPYGYRWLMTTEVLHPFHERCGSAHWPDETCEDRAHTASVAIGYQMTLDQARHRAQCETVGVKEGLRAVGSAQSLADLGSHHNRIAASWGASDRTDDDTAVLHGFMAVVRPVLAEMGHTAKVCGSCASGNCQNCTDHGCTCGKHGQHEAKKKKQPGGLANGGVTEQERAGAAHHLPGSGDKFPVSSAADVENGKHDIGRTSEPKAKVVNYLDDMAKEYGVAPVGGGKKKTKGGHGKAASLDPGRSPNFKEGAAGPGSQYGRCKECGDEATNQCSNCAAGLCSECGVRGSSYNRQGGEQFCHDCAGHHGRSASVDPESVSSGATAPGTSDDDETGGEAESMRAQAASGLPQIQQVTDPNNADTPQDDQLPPGVMFPIDPGFTQQWVTGPGGAQPKGGTEHEAGRRGQLPQRAAEMFGRLDAIDGRQPQHQDNFAFNEVQHGRYLSGWNNTAGIMHGMNGRAAMSKEEYHAATGRGDRHGEYLAAYAHGRDLSHSPKGPYEGGIGTTSSLQAQADAWSQPRQTTDNLNPPYNSAATTPPMHQDNGDYAAGKAAGQSDKASGQRPAFADNSSAVSPYVKGYAEGYSGSPRPQGAQDVPYSAGGDNGQGANTGEAQRAFQVAQASRTAKLRRVSAAFAPDELMRSPEFRKGYLFASKWRPGAAMVSVGSAKFEAGLYAGVTDRPDIQGLWVYTNLRAAEKHPELRRRIELHRSFTRKTARRARVVILPEDIYMPHIAGVTTDLITDGPGTSPDPMGSTPLNGPGTPPPMGGLSDPARPGGPSPYQGAPPLPGGPVVPDDVMGKPQQKPQQSGPFTQTFSGEHKENANLAPVAPNSADQPGYSNKDAYKGDPDRVDAPPVNPRLAAFRATVQAGMARMGAQQ